VGVFADHAGATAAVDEQRAAGFSTEQIGLAVRVVAEAEDVEALDESPPEGDEGAAASVLTGGVIGGLLGAAVTAMIPGIGPILAGGLLAGIGTGVAVGAVAGGFLGGLTGLGIPEEEAHYYDREFRLGRAVVTVQAGGRAAEVREILRRHGAYDFADPKTAPPTTLHIEKLDELL
jgi:hypothetical protein